VDVVNTDESTATLSWLFSVWMTLLQG